MFWKRKTPKIETVAVPVRMHNGFFSTENTFGMNPKALALRAEDSIRRAIGDGLAKYLVTQKDENGAEITMAMDEAYQDLQLVKMQNAWGGLVPAAQMAWFGDQAFIGYQTAAIIAQNWLVDKACTMPARDAVRHGYEVTVNDGTQVDPEVMDYIRRRDKAFGVKDNCVELIRMGRIFGIRIAMFQVDSTDPAYYEKPFNIDGVTPNSYKGIAQIDPYWITPELDQQSAANPASRHFYEPTWWRVNGKRIHRTHLIVMKNGDELTDILKPSYFYGGIPIPQKIAERVYAAERTANEAPMLAMTKRLITLTTDITQAMANPALFQQKMAEWSAIMNNWGVKVVGENEEVATHDTSLADLDAVIMTQYQIVAAAAEVPATKLLGTSPKGFGAAGDYEIESYHELLESIQEHDLSPMVNRHHALLIKSEVMQKFGIPFFHTEAMWKPVDTPTAKEAAEINALKATRDNTLVQAGAIDGTDIRLRIISDPDSEYTGIPEIVPGGPGDREAQQEAEAALEQPVTAKETAGKSDDGAE